MCINVAEEVGCYSGSVFLQQSEIMTITKENTYNYRVVRQFSVMAVVWGIVGMLVGVVIATQLSWPEFLTGIPWLSYGRLRPLHTNAVIFAFGGCALMATSYYVVQRTSNVRLFSDGLAEFTFWGWQLVIVAAAITLPLGYTQGKEYAELEWPIDILIAVVWVAYAIVFLEPWSSVRWSISTLRTGSMALSLLRLRFSISSTVQRFLYRC